MRNKDYDYKSKRRVKEIREELQCMYSTCTVHVQYMYNRCWSAVRTDDVLPVLHEQGFTGGTKSTDTAGQLQVKTQQIYM